MEAVAKQPQQQRDRRTSDDEGMFALYVGIHTSPEELLLLTFS